MGGLDDFQRFSETLDNELSKLDNHHPEDQPFVERWIVKTDGELKKSSLGQYLRNLRMTGQRLDQPITSLTQADMERHVYQLRHDDRYGRGGGGMSDGTVRNIEFVVRRFLTAIGDEVDGHDLGWAEDYELTTPPDSKVTPEDMLRPADINALRDGANRLRDIAIIEFLADTGARLSLCGSLRVGDVDLEGQRATYTPNAEALGLKGAEIREYPIIDSKSSIRQYLRSTHPRPDQDDVALFHKVPGHGNDTFSNGGALSPTPFRAALERAAENADLDKPVNPHNFRHSAISRMIREGYTRSEVEHRVHWTVDTDMWATYEHISAEEHNDAIFEKAGVVEASDDTADHVRRPCGNCSEPVAPQHDYCPQCGEATSKRARDLQQSATESVTAAMAEIDDMSRREFRAFVIQQLQTDPSPLGTHEPPSSSDSSNR